MSKIRPCTLWLKYIPHASQISLCFVPRPAVFELQAILRQVRQMAPKWPWTVKGQMYLIYTYNYSCVPNFTLYGLFGSIPSLFRVTGHSETSAPNDPNWLCNTKRSKVPHMLQPNTLFRSTSSEASHNFSVTGQFETSALNDPKMTWNAKRSKVPHINNNDIYLFVLEVHFATL